MEGLEHMFRLLLVIWGKNNFQHFSYYAVIMICSWTGSSAIHRY